MNPSFSNLQPTFISIHLKSLSRIVYTQVSGNLITCPYSSHCLAATPGYFTATLKLPTSPPISYSQLMTCLLISLKKNRSSHTRTALSSSSLRQPASPFPLTAVAEPSLFSVCPLALSPSPSYPVRDFALIIPAIINASSSTRSLLTA